MCCFSALASSGQNPNHSGDVGVFLNYKLLGKFKKKSDALKLVKKLILEAPKQAKSDFEKYDTITRFLT